jgi:hypothetical protein
MTMKRALPALAAASLVSACGGSPQPASSTPDGPVQAPHANLAQVMRAIPFPSSNIIFDTQTNDPAAAQKAGDSSAGATAAFSGVYGGWQAVENSALALAETANLILIPGRQCQNGKPVPLQNEDFRKFAQGLIDAGMAAYEAAKSKDLDKMIEVSGTVSDACAACHERYRDKPTDQERCS